MTPTIEAIQQDSLALAIARALALANEEATRRGRDLDQMLITITEEAAPPARVWRIHYGRRDYLNRRGGDLIVFVDEQAGELSRVLHGQ